jgi:Glycosyl hydrolases family 28
MPVLAPHRSFWLAALAGVVCALAGPAAARDCDVTGHGARADDELADTGAIQAAIDACAAAGGGRVILPNGRFVSGTLFLKSNIEFHLMHGALLLGSPRLADYAPSKEPTGSHTEGKRDGLLIAEKANNVAITGFGTIDGNGPSFWGPGFMESGESRPKLPRPMPWVEFRDSRFVVVRDVRFQHSPSYGVAFTRTQDVNVLNVKIFNDHRSPNTDGIQVNDSRRVSISGVHIATGDDAIVLKSDNADVEDVVVSDSILTSDDTAFKYGTGSTKAIRRVTLRDSTIVDSRLGIGLFMRRGGVYEDLEVRNVRIVGRSPRGSTEWPIYLDVDRRSAEFGFGTIRDIRFEGLRIESRGNVLIAGNPASTMQGIVLRDVEFRVVEPADLSKVRKSRGNVAFGTVEGSVDYATDNAHFTFGHVRGLVLDGVRIVGAPEALGQRRALMLRDVVGAEIARLGLDDRGAARTEPPLLARDSGDVLLADPRVRGAAPSALVETVGAVVRGGFTLCRRVVSECESATRLAQSR